MFMFQFNHTKMYIAYTVNVLKLLYSSLLGDKTAFILKELQITQKPTSCSFERMNLLVCFEVFYILYFENQNCDTLYFHAFVVVVCLFVWVFLGGGGIL